MIRRNLVALVVAVWLSAPALAQDVLFTNVRIFDGRRPTLSAPSSVLVKGNLIEAVSEGPIAAPGATRIDGGGRTLMPGLIDAHWHNMLIGLTPAQALASGAGYLNLVAELLALTGLRNPYPAKLGVVEPGAYADLLLVDGNPLEKLASPTRRASSSS